MPKPVSIRLLSKPGCHLCDDARAVIEAVRTETAARGIVTELEELDILQHPDLARRHSEDIPVVQVGERRVAIWRVDPAKLTAAIERAAQGPKLALFRR